MPENLSVLNEYVAGAAGGIAGLVVGFPFDTTKVQMQIQNSKTKYKTAWDAVLNIKRQGLVQGFFRGLSLPLFSYGIVNSVFFGVYSHTLQLLSSTSCSHYFAIFCAGCSGATFALLPGVPAEVVKVVLQSQIPRTTVHAHTLQRSFQGPLQATRNIVALRGIRGLYRGITIHCLRDMPAGGIYFLVYNYLSDTITARFPPIKLFIVDFFAGGFAGVLSWFICNPMDVIKSKMQADFSSKLYRNTWHCTVQSYREEGPSVFLRGALVNAVRAFPVNAAIFMAYSYSIRKLSHYETSQSLPRVDVATTAPHASITR